MISIVSFLQTILANKMGWTSTSHCNVRRAKFNFHICCSSWDTAWWKKALVVITIS